MSKIVSVLADIGIFCVFFSLGATPKSWQTWVFIALLLVQYFIAYVSGWEKGYKESGWSKWDY